MRNIHHDARTRVKTCAQETEAIAVDRGVHRGIFTIYRAFTFSVQLLHKPLTCWLHVGGRGYVRLRKYTSLLACPRLTRGPKGDVRQLAADTLMMPLC